MNTECSACARSEVDPLRGGITYANCMGCQALSLARSEMASRAVNGDSGDLLAAIEKIWKEEPGAGANQVWRWIKRIKAFKECK